MKQVEKYQIFCDMDGVLVDLIRGVSETLYENPPENASKNYKKV